MGIYNGIREENKERAIMSLNLKDFEDMGYWLRDIKKKLKNFEILNIKITLSIDYYKEREENKK